MLDLEHRVGRLGPETQRHLQDPFSTGMGYETIRKQWNPSWARMGLHDDDNHCDDHDNTVCEQDEQDGGTV